MPGSQKFRLQVRSDLRALDQVLSWFDQFDESPIPNTTWMECKTALAEGMTNAIRHAHKDRSSDSPVEIELTLFPELLEIRIWDRGPGFDMDGWLANEQPPLDNEYLEHGRGLLMMQKLVDRLSYDRTADRRNCLLMVKHFPPQ
ncbi:MAG: ATP-binding protein [Desertifilum sp. SIO1I2]|nr:ATP-binding protein [Desertifilum sp. SIO1I2]